MKYGAVIIDSRNMPELVDIIKDHIKHIPQDWGLTIFFSSANEKMLKDAFPDANFNNLLTYWTPKSYCNDTMTSHLFWEGIPYDKIVFFQSDSMILRSGVEEFMHYDYVGAPWGHLLIGGNGGLSIRSKHKSIELLKKIPFDKEKHGNEDEYFSKYLHYVGGCVAPREICSMFSCESIFAFGTLGYHAIEKHLTEDQCNQIKNQYDLYNKCNGI
jgi:hypothetical protein